MNEHFCLKLSTLCGTATTAGHNMRLEAATMNFVKSLAKQLGPKGILVNGVAPGPIWTPVPYRTGTCRHI